ncbi:MAG TPA: serine/threonine-protein kinase [Candidatus Polarisedimenticolia bacterium]|jgi:predicted Ser/Thr protein kinase|nr:serine/threonine-protein kinase [Candidatus Polarisedimenticolia bacterium]
MIGKTLNNYRVEELLGKGGMGEVYRAVDTRLGRPVALKILRPDLVGDAERRRRFLQEARAASTVNHPAIAQIYEIGESDDTTFITMEYVDGSTIRQLVSRRELDLPAAVEVGIQVGDGLARAHEAGIIHRDIKSDNVMVTKDGHPKILDFGLAKLLDSGEGEAGSSRMETLTRTHAGMILGTITYMSPEQARGLPADRRSDVFSYGILLYEMTAGKVPFQGASALDTLHAIAYEPTQPVTTIRTNVPYSLQKVIDRCMQKKPEERYQDLRDAVTELKKVKREIESGASGGVPVLDRFRGMFGNLTSRGLLWATIVGAVLGALLISLVTGSERGNVGPLIVVLLVGVFLFRRFRNRGQREMRRFVKKASALKEVQTILFHRGQFTVAAENPTARTYLKLNALLTAANERLYHGEPMTLVVREGLDEAESRSLLSMPGVQFVREGRRKAARLSSAGSGS